MTTVLAALLLLAACTAQPPAGKLDLEPVAFAELPGWNADHVSEAVPALQHSCKALTKQTEWQAPCAALEKLPPGDDAAARGFFEKYFRPFAARGPNGDTGLFTGYYEAELHGAWKRDKRYGIPLYAKPDDLVTVDLGDFEKQWRGKHIEGKVVKDRLMPYDDRAAIEHLGLKGRARALLWVDDPVDAFFLSVQGSGRVVMKNGEVVHVGYAAPNGRDYVAIGRVMAEMGMIEKPVTMQKIRAWLSEHPEQMRAVLDKNSSYVFYRIIPPSPARCARTLSPHRGEREGPRCEASGRVRGEQNEGPIGAEGVPLTPRRSLAVDPAYVPLGAPVWVDINSPPLVGGVGGGGDQQEINFGSRNISPLPNPPHEGEGMTWPLRRLMIAQDTGGAIKGPVRGDFFWGYGPEAEAQAGEMQSEGRYYLLVLKN